MELLGDTPLLWRGVESVENCLFYHYVQKPSVRVREAISWYASEQISGTDAAAFAAAFAAFMAASLSIVRACACYWFSSINYFHNKV